MGAAAQGSPDGSVTRLPDRTAVGRQRAEDMERWTGEVTRLSRAGVPVAIRGQVATADCSSMGEWQEACRTLQATREELRRFAPGAVGDRVWVERHHGPFRVKVQVDAAIALDEDREARAERALVAAAEVLS